MKSDMGEERCGFSQRSGAFGSIEPTYNSEPLCFQRNRIPFRNDRSEIRPGYRNSMPAITICGITLFQLSGRLSNGSRNGFVSPGARPPTF